MSTGGVVQSVVFSVALPPRELRRNVHTVPRKNPKPGQSARRALHWRDRSKAAEEYAEAVWIAGYGAGVHHHSDEQGWEKARVRYVWHSTHQVDEDNAISSLKVLLDCLTTKGRRPLGILVDDKGVSVSACWVKVARKQDERVEVYVTEVRE